MADFLARVLLWRGRLNLSIPLPGIIEFREEEMEEGEQLKDM